MQNNSLMEVQQVTRTQRQQLNTTRKMMHEQNEKFDKEIGTIQKKKKIPELKIW